MMDNLDLPIANVPATESGSTESGSTEPDPPELIIEVWMSPAEIATYETDPDFFLHESPVFAEQAKILAESKAIDPKIYLSEERRQVALDAMWKSLKDLRRLEIGVFETGIGAFVRLEKPLPPISHVPVVLGISLEISRAILEWVQNSGPTADYQDRPRHLPWLILAGQSNRIRDAVMLLLENTGDSFAPPPLFSQLNHDLRSIQTILKALSSLCDLMSDLSGLSDDRAGQEAAALQASLVECISQLQTSIDFSERATLANPKAALTLKEQDVMRAHRDSWIFLSSDSTLLLWTVSDIAKIWERRAKRFGTLFVTSKPRTRMDLHSRIMANGATNQLRWH